jgi:hypothetical protein
LKYAYPTDSGINKECTIARPNQEVQLEQDADGRHCVDLQTVAYMGFKPKQIEMDNRYMLVTDGGESATFEMETLEIEKVGMCFGSSDPVDIWLWQRRGCVEAPADVDTSSNDAPLEPRAAARDEVSCPRHGRSAKLPSAGTTLRHRP